MDTKLIDRATAFLAEFEHVSVTCDELGALLLPLCLEEPSLAPLAEAVTRPQLPACPAPSDCPALLNAVGWQNPFVLVCGRLLAQGPWPERAFGIAEALSTHRSQAGEVTPILVRLILATAELEGAAPDTLLERLDSISPGNPRIERLRQSGVRAPRPLVLVDELYADPELLDLYLSRFGDDADAALVIYAPGWTPDEVAARIGPIIEAAGPAAERARLTALAVEATAENDWAAAGSATALLGHCDAPAPFSSLPRIARPVARH